MAQGVLPFQIETTPARDEPTSFAGLPLVVEALRVLLPRHFHRGLASALGYRGWKVVRRHLESLLLLIIAGGSCIDDLHRLRADKGLRSLIGFKITAPTQAKDFLYRFHQAVDGSALTPEQDALLAVQGHAQIRPEGPGLQRLSAVVDQVVGHLQQTRPVTRATLDVDATLVQASKARALRCFEGFRGYQPQMAWWAEQEAWVADEFRDGNVPAEYAFREFLQRAFGALPTSVLKRRLRADTAAYNEQALTWTDQQGIQFAVSADVSPSLREAADALHDGDWRPYVGLDDRDGGLYERQWAELNDFVPDWARNRKPGAVPFRYLAIRVRSRQGDLFGGPSPSWRIFAVVTNMDWRGDRLLRWHREKQGTVERAHGVDKNDLAAGVLPTGLFGANAAWSRLNVLAQNLLCWMQVVALPPRLLGRRPKALRFHVFGLAGRLIRTGRRLLLRIGAGVETARELVAARGRIRDAALAPT